MVYYIKYRGDIKMSYNKDYFRGLLNKITEPLKAHYTPECSGLIIGHTGAAYEDTTIPMEGFSRVLWGLVPLWAGGGDAEGFAEIYQKGLSNGTDPDSNGYWGGLRDFDQKFVEMAAIAYALLLAPEKVWTPLSEKSKSQLADWLRGINSKKVSDNNWEFFPLLVNLALKKLGLEYSNEKIEHCLERLETYYLGSGWYKDGVTEQRDYYTPFALHFYSLIYSVVCEKDDPERSKLFKERAAEFAKTYVYWFDDKGRALVYGRSLTYRFAQAAFWSACVFADVKVFTPGILKGIIVRHFEDWFSRPIFDNGGLLTIGYRYPNLHMAESYNAPGSPYWSLKAFILLAADDNNPFWDAEPEPLPKLDDTKLIPEAQMIIQRQKNSVTALVPGRTHYNIHVHVSEKYCKFAYSSEFGFSVPRSNKFLNQSAPDSTLSFEIDGYIFTRRLCDSIEVSEDKIVSVWSPFKGINVTTTLIPIEGGHIRRHTINSEYECTARDSGFTVSTASDCHCDSYKEDGGVTVKNDFSFCHVKSNTGGIGEVISIHPNTSLVYQNTVLPMAVYKITPGITEIETVVKYS